MNPLEHFYFNELDESNLIEIFKAKDFYPQSVITISQLDFSLLNTFTSRAMSLIHYYQNAGNCNKLIKLVIVRDERQRIFSSFSGGQFYILATDSFIKYTFEAAGHLISCSAAKSKLKPLDMALLYGASGEAYVIEKSNYFMEMKSNHLINPIFDLLIIQIICHELAHIYFGHLLFKVNIKHHLGDINLPRERIIRCLEGDADCFGALAPIRLRDGGARLPISIIHHEQILGSIEEWAATAFMFYSHLAVGQFERDAPPKEHHRTTERCIRTIGAVDRYRNLRDGNPEDTIGDDLISALSFAGCCINSAFPDKIPSLVDNAKNLIPLLQEEDCFHSDWKVIRPFLDLYRVADFKLAP